MYSIAARQVCRQHGPRRLRPSGLPVRVYAAAMLFLSWQGAASPALAATVPNLVGIEPCSHVDLAQQSQCLLSCLLSGNCLESTIEETLAAAGLTLGQISYVESDLCTQLDDEVVSQDPTAGVVVPDGSAVDVVVMISYTGTEKQVPDLAGLTYWDALDTLAPNFSPGTVSFAADWSTPAGDVLGQVPAADACTEGGSTVDIVLSSGEAAGGSLIFADDFRTPDTSAWSQTTGVVGVSANHAVASILTECMVDDVVLEDVVIDDFAQEICVLACNSVTATNVQVTFVQRSCARSRQDGEVTFTAGHSIRLGPSFLVDAGARFSADIDPSVDDPFSFLADDSPLSASTYNARFDMVPILTLISGEDIGHFNGYSADGTLQFSLVLRDFASQDWLALFARDNVAGALVEHTADFPLSSTSGYYGIQVLWESGAGTGRFQVSIDGDPLDGISGLNNATSRIDYVRWGVVDGNLVSTTGWVQMDNFLSWD